MHKVLIPSIALAALSHGSLAAEPPLFHSLNELKALLSSVDLVHTIGVGRRITGLSKVGDTFTITAENCTLTVKSSFSPRTDEFSFSFGTLNCR
jgi:hypothetical protein